MASLIRTLVNRVNSLVHLSQFSTPFNRMFFHIGTSISRTSKLNITTFSNTLPASSTSLLLCPQLPLISQVCGFKVKYKLRKRCKDCYLVVREERAHIICPTHPRHKQMAPVKKPKYTWTIVHASQSPDRPW